MIEAVSKKSELYGIQMLRAVAALAVVGHHALEESNGAAGRFSPDWLTTAGASGVDIFFVISGFIMLHVGFGARRSPPTPSSFLFRRATRIYPLYWFCCATMLSISAIGLLSAHHHTAATIIDSFLLLPGSDLIGVSWTLVYEIYFYLIFAVMLRARSASLAIVGTTTVILLAYAASMLLPPGEWSRFLGSPLPLEFCFGLALAFAYDAALQRRQQWRVPVVVAGPGLVLLAVAPLVQYHASTNGLPALPRVALWGLPSALIVAACLTVGEPRTAATRFAVLLGNASYALYLTHVFVMLAYARLIKTPSLGNLPQAPVVVGVIAAAVAIGIATHLLVERPLATAIRRLPHRQPGHSQPA